MGGGSLFLRSLASGVPITLMIHYSCSVHCILLCRRHPKSTHAGVLQSDRCQPSGLECEFHERRGQGIPAEPNATFNFRCSTPYAQKIHDGM